jgi:DNA (cytosine-5)-methyltransferase 1
MRKMLVADLFCGAGGSSTGARNALKSLGLEMELVVLNHWPTAIETHTKNHPEARHYCQDIATLRPHLAVPEGYLDLLMASPSCTHHSVARGGRPTSDQQRSDPWHIITWFTELSVKRALIENVPEFLRWGPVGHTTKRPIKGKEGEYFRAWVANIERLGGTFDHRILNCADFGDATTRRRFFALIRFDKRKTYWPEPSHGKRREGGLDLTPALKPWKPAREIIDWGIKGRSILNRKKPLSPKTLARIYAGARKFGWPEPFLVILRNHMDGQSVDQPIPTVAANGTHIGLAQPVIVNGRKGNKAKSVETDPVPTLDTKGGVWLAEPFVLSTQNSGAPRSVDEPTSTITTGGAGVAKRPGCGRPMLVEPFILSRNGSDEGPNERRARSVDEPAPTATVRGAGYVIEPFMLSQASGGAPRSTDHPVPAIPCDGAHALIAPYYGSGSGETCKDTKQPLDTVTAKARFGMVVPITHQDGSDRARDVDTDPLATITTAHRGELAFITAAFGERDGQAPRVHDIAEPAPSITAQGRINLAMVEMTEGYDILFRMLEPHELAAAMGFTTDEHKYEFAGTKTDQIKQIGNAVPVGTATALVKAIMADAAEPKRRKAA